MNPANPTFAALKDIHLPQAMPWWDIAMGWWLLSFLASAAIVVFIYQFPRLKAAYMRKQRHSSIQHAMVAELQHIKDSFQNDANHPLLLSELSQFLRRIALTVFQQHQVSGTIGLTWLHFLDEQWVENKPSPSFIDPDIANLLQNTVYQASFSTKDEQNTLKLLNITERWVHEVSKHHV